MQNYRDEFINYCIQQKVLQFGQFELKSGRVSPYFFNASKLIETGAALMRIGQYYAQCIQEHPIDFDVLFGPAYKGIALTGVTATTLYQQYNRNVGFCHDRKEHKSHGEGGVIVGETDLVNKKVLILDDVITAGTAIKHSMQILAEQQAQVVGIVVMFDRQEKDKSGSDSIKHIANTYQARVSAIINLDDMISYLKNEPKMAQHLKDIMLYREQYGT